MRSLILRAVAEAILPATLLFAVHLLLRGHDEPGGGFIAGLVTSAGLVLQTMAFGGRPWTRSLAGRGPGIGVATALLVGLLAVPRGAPLLAHTHGRVPTTLIFDVGVFVAVVGTLSAVLTLFAERTR